MKFGTFVGAVAAALIAVSASAAPTPVRVSEVRLQRAYFACIGVAANWPSGQLSTHAKDWPSGFRGCAVVMREIDRRGQQADRVAWEKWYARHAKDRALIELVAWEIDPYPIDWKKFKHDSALEARKAACK